MKPIAEDYAGIAEALRQIEDERSETEAIKNHKVMAEAIVALSGPTPGHQRISGVYLTDARYLADGSDMRPHVTLSLAADARLFPEQEILRAYRQSLPISGRLHYPRWPT